MMNLELDDILRQAGSELSDDDWAWVDQTVDSMLESLGLEGLDLEDFDLNMELDELFSQLGVDDPDDSISDEYVENLTKLNEALQTNDAEIWRQASLDFKKYYHGWSLLTFDSEYLATLSPAE